MTIYRVYIVTSTYCLLVIRFILYVCIISSHQLQANLFGQKIFTTILAFRCFNYWDSHLDKLNLSENFLFLFSSGLYYLLFHQWFTLSWLVWQRLSTLAMIVLTCLPLVTNYCSSYTVCCYSKCLFLLIVAVWYRLLLILVFLVGLDAIYIGNDTCQLRQVNLAGVTWGFGYNWEQKKTLNIHFWPIT